MEIPDTSFTSDGPVDVFVSTTNSSKSNELAMSPSAGESSGSTIVAGSVIASTASRPLKEKDQKLSSCHKKDRPGSPEPSPAFLANDKPASCSSSSFHLEDDEYDELDEDGRGHPGVLGLSYVYSVWPPRSRDIDTDSLTSGGKWVLFCCFCCFFSKRGGYYLYI